MKYWHKLELTTEPLAEPVSLAEARLWLKVNDGDTADDDLITSLIETSRKMAEDYCNRAFIDQTWTLSLNDMPEIIDLPKGYIDSVTSINVYADDGTATLQSSTMYQVETGEGGLIFLESGNTWTTSTRPIGAMKIVFKAGYGAAAAAVPEGIKTGIKNLIAYLSENREAVELPIHIKNTLDKYKVFNI